MDSTVHRTHKYFLQALSPGNNSIVIPNYDIRFNTTLSAIRHLSHEALSGSMKTNLLLIKVLSFEITFLVLKIRKVFLF